MKRSKGLAALESAAVEADTKDEIWLAQRVACEAGLSVYFVWWKLHVPQGTAYILAVLNVGQRRCRTRICTLTITITSDRDT